MFDLIAIAKDPLSIARPILLATFQSRTEKAHSRVRHMVRQYPHHTLVLTDSDSGDKFVIGEQTWEVYLP